MSGLYIISGLIRGVRSAGAAHEEHVENRSPFQAEHGYSWGAIRVGGDGNMQLGWAPRVYVPFLDNFRADRTRYDLEADGFIWEDIRSSLDSL